MQQDMRDELLARLKLSDFSQYLIVRRAPPAEVDRLLTLFGFYRDLTEIGFRVEDPQLRLIRLAWWRESIEQLMGGQMSGHPICDELDEPLQEHGDEMRGALLDVIDGVTGEISGKRVEGAAELFEAFRLRYGGLIKAQLLVTGGFEEAATGFIRPASDAMGVAALIAGELGAGGSGFLLPQDLLAKYELLAEEVFGKEHVKKTAQLFEEIAKPLIIGPAQIRQLMKEIAPPVRTHFSGWYLAGLLYNKAMKARQKGDCSLIRLNPLMIYLHLMRF